jgi:hypothetical protein
VTKYDAAGTEIWTRQFGSTGNGVKVERAHAVSVDAQRNVYVAGSTGSTLPGQTSAGAGDVFLRKYSDSGVEAWTRQFGTASSEVALSTTVDASGHVFVAGQTAISDCGQSPDAAADAFVHEFDGSGTAIRTVDISSSADDRACSVSANAGAVFVAGGTMGALAGQASSGGFDAFVLKLP